MFASKTGIWLLIAALFLVACTATAPIQEMSDARQAISAATAADAAKHAPDTLEEAGLLLRSAERNLAIKAYAAARRDAVLAKETAMAAREAAEAVDGQPDRMTEQPLK